MSISCGDTHCIGVTIDGLVYGWGANDKGQLGINTSFKKYLKTDIPTLIEALIGVYV